MVPPIVFRTLQFIFHSEIICTVQVVCILDLLLQCGRGTDRNLHCFGQTLAAHSGSRICGHLRAGVRNEVIPDVHGTDRGRNVIMYFKICPSSNTFLLFKLMFQNSYLKLCFASTFPIFLLHTNSYCRYRCRNV
jgi:hypothetical protein